MNKLCCVLVFIVSPIFAAPASSQTVDVNRQNRTIELIVTQKIEVVPDIADVTIGCISYGTTHDQAYRANLEAADKVIKALLGAGVAKAQIESSTIELSETNPGDNADQSNSSRKVRQFKAHQAWKVRLRSQDAQRLIDTAVQAGANGIEDVVWDVLDPDAVEARARTAAIEKARITAADMAKTAGGKVGDMLYASNTLNGLAALLAGRGQLETEKTTLGQSGTGFPNPDFSLQLFPEKITRQATVRVVFALE